MNKMYKNLFSLVQLSTLLFSSSISIYVYTLILYSGNFCYLFLFHSYLCCLTLSNPFSSTRQIFFSSMTQEWWEHPACIYISIKLTTVINVILFSLSCFLDFWRPGLYHIVMFWIPSTIKLDFYPILVHWRKAFQKYAFLAK